MLKKGALVALIALLCGCTPPIRQFTVYEGDRQPADVAVLHVPREIKVESLDGKGGYSPFLPNSPLFPYKGARFSLMPGEHTVEVRYSFGNSSTKGTKTIKQQFEPGKEYKVSTEFERDMDKFFVTYHIDEMPAQTN